MSLFGNPLCQCTFLRLFSVLRSSTMIYFSVSLYLFPLSVSGTTFILFVFFVVYVHSEKTRNIFINSPNGEAQTRQTR